MSVDWSRNGVVLANKSMPGYGLMFPSQNHYFHVIGKKPLIYYSIYF